MITIDIVTPTKKLLDGVKADWIKIPTVKGEIQVLPNHTDLLTIIETGPLSLMQDGKERKFAVSYGFAEVRKNKIMVMAETIEESTNIDKARAALAKKKAEEALASALTEEKFKKYQLKLQRAIVRQSL